MAKKYAHIKNPLTVIAIFATFVELGGTVVLPLLKGEVQDQYVWFLMGFPSFLVLLFFGVLWFKHEVLYAPKDYRNDDTFLHARGIAQASQASVLDKIIEEVDETRVHTDCEPVVDSLSGKLEISVSNVPASQDASGGSASGQDEEQEGLSLEAMEQPPERAPEPTDLVRSVQDRFKQENDALDLLSREKKTYFQRNVALEGGAYIFSGASITPRETLLVEVFRPWQIFNGKKVGMIQETVSQYYHNYHLGSDHVRFKFIVLIVGADRPVLFHKSIVRLKEMFKGYGVPHEVYAVNSIQTLDRV
ncbi:hypothetical protein F116p41 [Pseudomonas phage F116]|uniref:Uncharacterized protein n=1 Tax=Pseudomonas phage F116 TaxID=2679904 RepID=Q5QF73_9CAUD|nr:hypothetical protein F116p41 [Pseudomonas phage F116]AAT47234.1 unknown [Pseudomonas phage F116]